MCPEESQSHEEQLLKTKIADNRDSGHAERGRVEWWKECDRTAAVSVVADASDAASNACTAVWLAALIAAGGDVTQSPCDRRSPLLIAALSGAKWHWSDSVRPAYVGSFFPVF